MIKRLGLLLVVVVLTASACADAGSTGEDAAGASPSSTAVVTPSQAGMTSMPVPQVTTTSPEPVTTTSSPTTTITNSAESDVSIVLRNAFAESAAVSSGRMEGSIEMIGAGTDSAVPNLVFSFGGAFDNVSGDFSFFLDMSGVIDATSDEIPPELAGMFDEMEVRQIGETSYVKFGLFNQFLGGTTPWISMPADESDPTAGFATAPANPSEILESFESAGATVEAVGPETVNGVETTRYRAMFDMESLLANATPEELEKLEAQGPLPVDVMPMDVWISEDGLVVRFVMEIDGDSVEVDPVDSFDRMTMQYDMFDLNQPVVIEVPPESDITDVADLEAVFGFDV
ncbi:MAG: hypothetical protein M3132_14845 [Actinomycetia bacterium]|nr:hypothetical protein [Actinomycetes bacterium]